LNAGDKQAWQEARIQTDTIARRRKNFPNIDCFQPAEELKRV
jgi:hypothetical protein